MKQTKTAPNTVPTSEQQKALNDRIRIQAIYSIFELVSKCYPLDELREYTAEVCEDYYPEANKVLQQSFYDFAYGAQDFLLSFETLLEVIDEYNEQHQIEVNRMNSIFDFLQGVADERINTEKAV